MTSAGHEQMSEEEIAMIVALHNGTEPRPEDPMCLALEARGLARRAAGASWELTPDGVRYVSELT